MNIAIQAQILPRCGAALLMSALVTMALFLVMHSLIDTGPPVIDNEERIYFDPFMPELPEPAPIPENKIEKPADPEEVPEWETPTESLESTGDQLAIKTNSLPDSNVGDIDPNAGASTIVPVFRIAPDYPPSALRRGIEGYVDLVFDVAPSGKTENIRILAAEPEGVFERAATRTLAKWKYKAPVEDGVAYGQKGMTTRISFRLEQ